MESTNKARASSHLYLSQITLQEFEQAVTRGTAAKGWQNTARVEFKNTTSTLHLAVQYGSVRNARRLLRCGAQIDVTVVGYGTPLCTAAAMGNEETIRFLMKTGADVQATTKIGGTALCYAASKRSARTYPSTGNRRSPPRRKGPPRSFAFTSCDNRGQGIHGAVAVRKPEDGVSANDTNGGAPLHLPQRETI